MQPTTKAAVLNSLLSPDTCEVMNPSPRRNTGSQSLLLDLSDELIGVVISNIQLSLEDVMRASRVCSRLYRLTHEDAVWHRLYDAHFNGKTAERTASAKPVTPDNAATAASDGKQKAGSGLGSGASSTSNGPAASVSSAVGTSTPPPASGTWHERFKQRSVIVHARMQRHVLLPRIINQFVLLWSAARGALCARVRTVCALARLAHVH